MMTNDIRYISLTLLLFIACLITAKGQPYTINDRAVDDDTSEASNNQKGIRLDYGLNLGSYFANKFTANYYNGTGAYSSVGRQGRLEQIIGKQNRYNYERLRQQIGYDFILPDDYYPMAMRYNPAMMVGLFAVVSFSPNIALLAESNLSRLRIQDQFTIELERFSSIQGDNIERHSISGTEERVDIRIGLQYTMLSRNSGIHPFLEGGAQFTDTKVKSNSISIGGSTLSLSVPGSSQYSPERDYGIGLGGFLSLGIKMEVTEQFQFSLGYSGHYSNINLGTFDEYRLQQSLFLRFNLSGILR